MDDRLKISQVEDVDSIPVVRLDDVPAPSPGMPLDRFSPTTVSDLLVRDRGAATVIANGCLSIGIADEICD